MPLIIVSCGKHKLPVAAPASALYTSTLFAQSWLWAMGTGYPARILSAEHGLVSGDEVLAPYDAYLGDATPTEYRALVMRVRAQLTVAPREKVVVLGGSRYIQLVKDAAPEANVVAPMSGLSVGHRLRWLKQTMGDWENALALEEMYEILRDAAGGSLTGKTLPTLAETLEGRIPSRGLYFFFEDTERRSGRSDLRVTRVGTHAVSRGAASTLRSRLRTHAGTAALSGSHRSSIFRLHLGGALLADDPSRVASWGTGSGGTADAATRALEADLEREVSGVLRRMRVLLVSINDLPSAQSDRAYIERNAIGLLSTVGHVLDPPSAEWLGRSSRRPEIREHGVWNLDHLEYRPHPEFTSVLRAYVLASNDAEGPSLAPADWWQTGDTLF